jgi:hypothetical protein
VYVKISNFTRFPNQFIKIQFMPVFEKKGITFTLDARVK